MISDSPMFDRGIPSICYGLRGLAYFQIDLRGTKSDLHSGSFGGAVANPAMRAGADPGADEGQERPHQDSRVSTTTCVALQRGGARGVRRSCRSTRRKYRQDLGAPKLFGETGYTTLERIWARPTFEVNGLLSGFTGEGAKTVHPGRRRWRRSACAWCPTRTRRRSATCSRPTSRRVAPKTVELKLTRMHGGKPWMTAFDNPFVQAAGRAIEQGFGKAPVFNREGGSIPVVATFQEELGLPCVLFGVGLPDENAHAPDEKLDLGNFHNGIIASAFLYDEIGASAAL